MDCYQQMNKDELVQELMKMKNKISEFEKKNSDAQKTLNSQENIIGSGLDLESIKRYSRQLILPELGPKGQQKLINSSALIVGCGGLGCPAAIYLAAAGVGKLGLVDYDEVEVSNLHRQILHTESRIGISKANSISLSVSNLNGKVNCEPFIVAIDSSNIMDIVNKFDIILDCTDNVATRYLLNDACFFAGKPLVSGSALRFEGQLTIYGVEDGPCYRCLFPTPPPSDTVTNCSDGGVLGVVPGIIGCLQALETIKVLAGIGDICNKRMILFDALSLSFRNIKLRGRQPMCHLCGTNPTILELIDYEQFCGAKATDKDDEMKLLTNDKRITVKDLKEMIDTKKAFVLVDVRSPIELEICSLPNSLNVPITEIYSESSVLRIEKAAQDIGTKRVICLCRKGNDSQKSVAKLEELLPDFSVFDVIGGLTAWASEVDKRFPVY